MIEATPPLEIPAQGLVSVPIPNGGTCTLTTYLGEFLRATEKITGPRDMSWTILGIEFFGEEAVGAVPHTWYPGDCGHVAIRLTRDVASAPKRAVFQLAHEVVHLISPNGKPHSAPNLEEGLATLLAHKLAMEHVGFSCPLDRAYRAAHDDAAALLAINPFAVRDIRQIEPHLWQLTPDIVGSAIPGIDPQLAGRLCQNWYASRTF